MTSDRRPPAPAYDETFMRRAVALASAGVLSDDGGPFGAVVVLDGEVIGEGCNQVPSTNDPTAHAEVVAIRAACAAVGSFQLTGAAVYASCEPCPMCLGAIYWARPAVVYYACTKDDAAAVGFDDSLIYNELAIAHEARTIPFVRVSAEGATDVFAEWQAKADRTEY